MINDEVRFLIILSVFLFILRVPIAGAQWPLQMGMGRGHGHHPSWHPEDLQLTAEQMEKLESIQRSYLDDITPLRNDFLNKRYELRRLITDPTSKADDIRAKQEEAFELETQIQEKVIDYQLMVREILTPEQFRLWISRYQAGFGQRRGHRHGMGMGNH
ncbi:MAG: periplasmic heavy metal sensor [Deltaproteobacteria bacterium]|nr:periplasmic heavy metal sensor [Deltaproteobacteria bacterium]